MLYFAYTARIEPVAMHQVAPDAVFEFIAHLPEWGLDFPISGNGWEGGLPTVEPRAGDTVWGAVFTVPDTDAAALDAAEAAEQRTPETVEAIDRSGRRHQVVVHRAHDGGGSMPPSPEYLRLMVEGSRHWELPAGWIMRLEDHLDE